jgi:multiple sugar transport system substrate-binding protein
MKQIFSTWVSLVLVLLFLLSCSSQTEPTTTVTLSGWQSSPAERQILETVLGEFEATHPQIQVKFEAIADQYMDVIKTRLIGDAAPDVFYLDALEAPLLMSHDVLEPLDGYLSPEFDLQDFEPALLKAFQRDRVTYGLPKDFSTLALFYNQDLFRQANLTAPPKTWERLQEDAQTLTRDANRDGRPEQYGLGLTPELARHYFRLQAFGGRLTNRKGYATFASRRSLKGLQPIVDLYRRDRAAALPSDVGASSGSEMLGQGKTAMVFEGNWTIPYLKETFPDIEFATAEIPTLGRKKRTMIYTVAYVMNKKAKNKEAAWELIAYLTGKEGMKAWAKGGLVLPARRSVLAEFGYNTNPLYAPFIAGADYGTIWQAGETLPAIATHFNNQFLSALLGEQSLSQAMKKAQVAANKEIQASNY